MDGCEGFWAACGAPPTLNQHIPSGDDVETDGCSSPMTPCPRWCSSPTSSLHPNKEGMLVDQEDQQGKENLNQHVVPSGRRCGDRELNFATTGAMLGETNFSRNLQPGILKSALNCSTNSFNPRAPLSPSLCFRTATLPSVASFSPT